MKLTSENVETIFMDCLFEKESDSNPDNTIVIEGIVNNFGFNKSQIEKHKPDIYDMLKQLPDEFQSHSGGGMTFLNACNDKNGVQWTDLHQKMELLFVLGIAIKKAQLLLPRDMWNVLPGGMPYVVVL